MCSVYTTVVQLSEARSTFAASVHQSRTAYKGDWCESAQQHSRSKPAQFSAFFSTNSVRFRKIASQADLRRTIISKTGIGAILRPL
ncbi:hypothetical protein L3Y34_003353 [Caenorhabditis briggsae]|uniref:Uncharacterized protein n=1 Tax=Caenorhabditis briggsae TaxID=6238 RepID=A0AAE9AFR0_CAEBR|nr:hypothetical protein L3Y34_003353 [Caenorhabditis briggsae]